MDKNLPARREETFDLTTAEGMRNAHNWYLKRPWLWVLLGPSFYTGLLFASAYQYLSRQNTDTLEAQKTAAIDLIKAGSHQQDLDAMKITMDQTVGLDLGAQVEGIPIKAKIGKSGHMIVEAKYKR
jgi:hypothetical protein